MAPSTKKTATSATKRAAQVRGAQGETDVVGWYRRNGYEILARNWRCFEGELDVIARSGKTIAVCEVKSRSSSRFDPSLSINPAKQTRLRTAAFRWLQENPQQGNLRFDVAFVIGSEIRILEGAF